MELKFDDIISIISVVILPANLEFDNLGKKKKRKSRNFEQNRGFS